MNTTGSILMLDLRGILRDNVMVANIALSFVGMTIITIVGIYQHDNPAALEWYPFLIIMALITNPAAYGFLFGLLMVDERDTGVRKALAVSPVKPTYLLAVRTILSTGLMIVWPLFTVVVMNSTWDALPVSYLQILAVGTGVALVAPLVALSVASYATNKVEALAFFKGINFILILPLALEFIPSGELYQHLFLVSPTAWSFMAFKAFTAGTVSLGYLWVLGGMVYSFSILAVITRFYIKDTYKS